MKCFFMGFFLYYFFIEIVRFLDFFNINKKCRVFLYEGMKDTNKHFQDF